MPKKIVAAFIFLLISAMVSAQKLDKDYLQQQREQLRKEIDDGSW